MALLSPTPTDIYILLDESGSMEPYTAQTRQCVATMMEGNIDPKIKYTVITFSDNVEHGSNLARFKPPQHNGTQIMPAFQQMHALVHQRAVPEKIIVVFVSDGMDTRLSAIQLSNNFKLLGKLPVHSLLFTVGVGKQFPTGLVVDVLRPLYHMGHASLQSVLPVNSPDDIHWAFGQLEALMLEELSCPNSTPEYITEATSTRDIMLYVQARYNECVIKCARTGQTAQQNYMLLFDTKAAIAEASRIAKARLSSQRKASICEADRPAAIKPLVSNLLKETVYSPKACLTSTLSAITRLNTMLNDAIRGKVMAELSDEAKKELLGGQYVEGKHIAVANKYRAANFGTTKNSLLRLLRTYTPNAQDRELEDPINLATQEEYFEDARRNLQDFIPLTHTLPGILKVLSFVCRTITYKTPMPHDALQMNEWLAEVEALPQLIQRMTTFDFLERHNCHYVSRGERINGLMVLGGDKTSSGIFHHVQSLLLLKHPGLFILTARLAVAGSVLFFLLGSHETMKPWIRHELRLIDDICLTYTRQTLENWHSYVETATNTDFRMCLVTESPKLPAQCKCPGLTKFILALYAAATGGLGTAPYHFSIEELKDRHHATIVEFLARARLSMASCLSFDAQRESDAFLLKAWTTPIELEGDDTGTEHTEMTIGKRILTAWPTLQEVKTSFRMLVGEGLTVDFILSKFTEKAKLTAQMIKTARHYQFSVSRINAAFRNLASICGHGDDVSFCLTKAGLLGALQTANRLATGYDRFSGYEPPKALTKEEMAALASRMATEQLKKTVMSQVDSVTEQRYIAHHREGHSKQARIIPAQHIERFKQEFGLDIAVDWSVNASGLSNVACCSPECGYYLELLDTRPFRCHDTICPRLHQHLMMGTSAQPLPGFHKTVTRFREVAPQRVAVKVQSGECLDDPSSTPMAQRCFRSLEDRGARAYLQHRLSVSIDEKRTRLLTCIKEKCDEIKAGGEDALEEEIATLQSEFSAPTWPYHDFKQVFLAKYKKYFNHRTATPHFTQQ